MKEKVKNAEEVRRRIKEYYRDKELWIPEDPNWRVFKFEALQPDGSTRFIHVKDRMTNKAGDHVAEEKLREHLLKHTPVNVYFMVSCFLNPSKTRHKTYKTEYDGREHRDKNHFLYSDMVIDFDHRDTEEVMRCYEYLAEEKGIPEEKMDFVFSGNGWHINIWKFYRNREIADPIEREKHAYQVFQSFAKELKEEGFEFDYHEQVNKKTGESSMNSPTGDTRRIRKLPETVTKHGTKAEVVSKRQLHSYTEEQVMEIETTQSASTLEEEIAEVKALG